MLVHHSSLWVATLRRYKFASHKQGTTSSVSGTVVCGVMHSAGQDWSLKYATHPSCIITLHSGWQNDHVPHQAGGTSQLPKSDRQHADKPATVALSGTLFFCTLLLADPRLPCAVCPCLSAGGRSWPTCPVGSWRTVGNSEEQQGMAAAAAGASR